MQLSAKNFPGFLLVYFVLLLLLLFEMIKPLLIDWLFSCSVF